MTRTQSALTEVFHCCMGEHHPFRRKDLGGNTSVGLLGFTNSFELILKLLKIKKTKHEKQTLGRVHDDGKPRKCL